MIIKEMQVSGVGASRFPDSPPPLRKGMEIEKLGVKQANLTLVDTSAHEESMNQCKHTTHPCTSCLATLLPPHTVGATRGTVFCVPI